MGSGKQYMHSINIGNSSDDVLKEPTKKGQRATIAERSPKDHRMASDFSNIICSFTRLCEDGSMKTLGRGLQITVPNGMFRLFDRTL